MKFRFYVLNVEDVKVPYISIEDKLYLILPDGEMYESAIKDTSSLSLCVELSEVRENLNGFLDILEMSK